MMEYLLHDIQIASYRQKL